jgi:hypothetical protein
MTQFSPVRVRSPLGYHLLLALGLLGGVLLNLLKPALSRSMADR